MLVYDYKGRNPLNELEHIKSLLGDLFHGYHAYNPGHEQEDGSIVLHPLSKEEEEVNREEYKNDVHPSLLSRRLDELYAILTQDGYECKR